MFQFKFSVIKNISKNTSSYPIILDDIKKRSEYFRKIENKINFEPYDNLNNYITCIIIPKIIYDWEKTTGYLLLDQTIQAFIPNLKTIYTNQINLEFNHLNIREFNSLKYYPCDWDYEETKTIIDSSKYFFIPEAGVESAKLNFKDKNLPLELFPMKNNLEITYKCGFENNNFTALNKEIKDALACQAASIIDSEKGFCSDYNAIISQVYAEYTINKQMITII